MNWNRVEGSWKFYKGKIKENWGKLTEDDLYVMNGKREQLLGLQQKSRVLMGNTAGSTQSSRSGS